MRELNRRATKNVFQRETGSLRVRLLPIQKAQQLTSRKKRENGEKSTPLRKTPSTEDHSFHSKGAQRAGKDIRRKQTPRAITALGILHFTQNPTQASKKTQSDTQAANTSRVTLRNGKWGQPMSNLSLSSTKGRTMHSPDIQALKIYLPANSLRKCSIKMGAGGGEGDQE